MGQHVDWSQVEALDPSKSEPTLDLFGILWRRKWVVACVLVISLALSYLYYLQATRVYGSMAQVLLIRKEARLPITNTAIDADHTRGPYSNYEDVLSTHMLLICSPLLVNKAVDKHHLGSLSSLKGYSNPTPLIIEGLKAIRAGDRNTPDPNVIELWYYGGDPQECATILNAVIQCYQEFLADTFVEFGAETLQQITQAKDVLRKQLTEKEAAFRQFKQDSPLISFGTGDQAANVHEMRLAEIEKVRALDMVQNAELKARIEAIENAVKTGGSREALLIMINKAQAGMASGQRSDRDALEERLFIEKMKEQEMLADFGPNHPNVKAIRGRIKLLQERLGNTSLPESAEPSDFIAVYLESLRQELKVNDETLTKLNAQFEGESAEAKRLAGYRFQNEQFVAEIARTQHMFDAVIKRLEEVNLIKDLAGGINTQVISPPGRGALVKPRLSVMLIMATLLGTLIGFSVGYLIDRADKSFRSPEEIRRQLGVAVIGHIPTIEVPKRKATTDTAAGKVALAPSLCTYHQPTGRSAEAYRAVRTALYFSSRAEELKVIQITSPYPGDGKTTLAANLSVSMADSGKRILLLEADFRRPRIHKYFALSNAQGVSSVINGTAALSEVVQATPVKNLWAIPCGPKPHNPSDLLTSPQFKEMLDTVREQYDFVIIDSPPILAVTDSSVVAPRVDAVLMIIRLTNHAREGAARAVEVLNGLGARVVGVVVNGIGRSMGYGYGYRSYAYRYGGGRYGYNYRGYGFNYRGSTADNYYYSDDAPDAPAVSHREAGNGKE